eukprot:365203-Chlamydomonas_euryale.AAC.18
MRSLARGLAVPRCRRPVRGEEGGTPMRRCSAAAPSRLRARRRRPCRGARWTRPDVQDSKAARVESPRVKRLRNAVLRCEQQVAAACREPQAVVRRPAHVLDAARRGPVVRLPVRLAALPRHEEVAARRNGHVVAGVVTAHVGEVALVVRGAIDAGRNCAVERCVDRLLHRRTPRVRAVVGDIDGALVGCHFRLTAVFARGDQDGRARQLGGKRHALPALAAIGRVQQDGGLAHNPALVTAEADRVEAVVEALVLCGRHVAWVPGLATVHRLQQRLAGANQEAVVGVRASEAYVQQHNALVHRQLNHLPVAADDLIRNRGRRASQLDKLACRRRRRKRRAGSEHRAPVGAADCLGLRLLRLQRLRVRGNGDVAARGGGGMCHQRRGGSAAGGAGGAQRRGGACAAHAGRGIGRKLHGDDVSAPMAGAARREVPRGILRESGV